MGSKIARRQVKFKQKSLTPSKKNLKKKPTQNQINKQHCTCTKKKKTKLTKKQSQKTLNQTCLRQNKQCRQHTQKNGSSERLRTQASKLVNDRVN